MKFGDRIRTRRMELGLSRNQLANRLEISPSAVSNYETGVSFPKEAILLRLFDSLETDPNSLFQDSFQQPSFPLSQSEENFIRRYRSLSRQGRQAVCAVLDALCPPKQPGGDGNRPQISKQHPKEIPLYRNPAAAGYAAPVFGKDFDYLPVTAEVPPDAEFAVRIQDNSMAPYILDGTIVYVNRGPLKAGDIGIFCVDGEILCKQYYKDSMGNTYLFSLNRGYADADVNRNSDLFFTANSDYHLICFGRVLLHAPPLPGKVS